MFIIACSSFRMAGGSQIAQKGKRGNFSTGTSDRKIQVGNISEKKTMKVGVPIFINLFGFSTGRYVWNASLNLSQRCR
jgi:hypothetical protein